MKKIFLPIVLIASFAISSFAQMTKEEEKEWSKKMKTLTPESYKQMIEERDALSNEVSQLKNQNSDLETKLSGKDSEIAAVSKQLQDTITALQSGAASHPATTTAAPEESHKTTSSHHTSSEASKGLIYKVQIGVFKNKDLSKYFENNPNFSGETDEDGSKKYTLGSFTNYWEAENFKKYLREMGVKDAWVVSYKNGKRVDIKDALEGTL